MTPGPIKFADKVKACFTRDSLLQEEYNRGVANGKWAHMMDQTRIGLLFLAATTPQHYAPGQPIFHRRRLPTNKIFMEQEGYVSIEAEKLCPPAKWQGVTLGGDPSFW